MVTDEQVRALREQMAMHGKKGLAALRAGMHRDTARAWLSKGKMPSESKQMRNYRTRRNPFEEIWPKVVEKLEIIPEVEAKALYEGFVLVEYPDRFSAGQLRTFQRHVRRHRAAFGPPKPIFFPQVHRPGEMGQMDWTCCNSLGITIGGEPFDHRLCHCALTYSNFEWPTVCLTESLASARRGFQSFVFELGHVPEWLQTDNSSAATHRPGGQATGREFNEDYEALLDHFDVKPRTTAIGAKEQNGDIESLNGSFKNRLEQHLLLRGSRDFESVEQYEHWLQEIARKANALRGERLTEELAAMRRVRVARLPEYTQTKARVTKWSTVRIKENTYSVPSRLRDEWVQARVYDDRIEVYFAGALDVTVPRLRGRNQHRINYRHVIWSLVQKPGAFARYRYREDLFPTLVFRMAYDALGEQLSTQYKSDLEYLRVLHLAASTMESDVEAAIELLLEEGVTPTSDRVKELVCPAVAEVPQLQPIEPDPAEYDELLSSGEEAA